MMNRNNDDPRTITEAIFDIEVSKYGRRYNRGSKLSSIEQLNSENPPWIEWKQIDWSTVNHTVRKLRSQIFLATLHGEKRKVRILQLKLINSKMNLLYSIRKITSTNKGKMTPGIDKKVYLKPAERFNLFLEMGKINILEWEPMAARRLLIPRPGKDPRPLGIPTIKDRVLQLIVVNSLEPEWEAKFEHSSYGFRPSRSTHDAMMRIWRTLSKKKRLWILDADIKGCFNNIAHDPLLDKIEDFPAKALIERWLKAGYIINNKFWETETGTPQGGPLSPLLANIALHGMEKALGIRYHTNGYVRSELPHVTIRYADDFLVLSRTKEDALKSKEIINEFLRKRGMEFSEEKTKIINVTEGFDFLGWNFRLFEKDNSKRNNKRWLRAKGEQVMLVQPSQSSIKRLQDNCKQIFREMIGQEAAKLIMRLNPKLKGWAQYHSKVNCNQAFRDIDYFLYKQAMRYARRKHPLKSISWIRKRYFKTSEVTSISKRGKIIRVGSNWNFHDGKWTLFMVRSQKKTNHVSIQYGKYPDHPDHRDYFLKRKMTDFSTDLGYLNKVGSLQNWICPGCGDNIMDNDWGEPLILHHDTPRKRGGKDNINNYWLMHGECHRTFHSNNPLIEGTNFPTIKEALPDTPEKSLYSVELSPRA